MSDDRKARFTMLMDEVFNRGNYDAADQFVAEDFFNHEAPDSPGPEGFKATARWLRAAFPDYHAEMQEFVADGDLMVARLVVSGTHAGDYMGIAPTGRSFSVQHMAHVPSQGRAAGRALGLPRRSRAAEPARTAAAHRLASDGARAALFCEDAAMADPVPAGSDVSSGTYKCSNCGYKLDVGSSRHLPPCPSCGNGNYETLSGGDSKDDPYPDR